MSESAPSARWITFEGIEGSGKSTQVRRLADRLRQSGHALTVTHEPGGTELGARIRSLLLRPTPTPMASLTELLLYTADRSQHLSEIVLPALEAGENVLCDRYLDATLAYQGYGRQLGCEQVLELHRYAPLNRFPNRTLLFDLDVAVGLERARERNRAAGLDVTEGRFEDEAVEFHERVRQGYRELAAADTERFRVIKAHKGPDEVEKAVLASLSDWWPNLDEATR
jgi:dTMP kinase